LRRNGRTIDPAGRPSDQIAAIALALGQCTVGSEDGDRNSVPGLSVENWAVQNAD
jgi:tRNA(fMet)-specific endonuclease VapC